MELDDTFFILGDISMKYLPVQTAACGLRYHYMAPL